ncbi:hypothetical protein [Caulobacter phage Cr30]|uniref:terminase small subunit n=1 Tax=Caulobacter phage Cr30 TaxID=1357714 RepID=UPI0004A9B478|nr:terminase small subunit [Caulobacter phage Cr30]AGS80999.1 hypothetical protein [Caulobacter phage Cr30]
MSRAIVAMIGLPAVGKSTIFKEFMKLTDDWELVPRKNVAHHYSKKLNAVIIGKYEDGEVFPGTDRLGLNTQPHCKEFIEEASDVNFFFEGDRIGNQSMFEWIAELDDTDFTILNVVADPRTISIRHKKRNDDQSEQFLNGRETKIAGICKNFVLMDYVETVEHETSEDTQKIVELMRSKLK